MELARVHLGLVSKMGKKASDGSSRERCNRVRGGGTFNASKDPEDAPVVVAI